MKKLKLSHAEIDQLVVVGRVENPSITILNGKNDVNSQVSVDGKHCWQYSVWFWMLRRSFCQKYKSRCPTYKGVTCCNEWLSFANFLGWVNKEVGYSGKPEGVELDKDLIIRGCKTYSQESCSFVPKEVNRLLNDHGSVRGEWPVGVFYQKREGRFVAQLSYNGKQKRVGRFNTPEEAFLAYKTAKEAQIKAVANQYKDVLKPAVYESLMNWEIEP